ncbi:hypothetical protein AOLI_G00188680 [Acnodon oligacanthus]
MALVALCALLLLGVVGPVVSDQHSLYYIYTALNKDVALPGIHEFTALGLLDDRAIDYYNSKEQVKVPKQNWMKEKMQADYWDKGTQSRKSKEQWFKVNVDILMQRMRHNQTDLHVLQWRHGCEIDESNGDVTFLKGIDEYSYDGKEFLSFDDENMRWIAPVPEAQQTKRKWDDVPILNQYTKGYLEKECVDWLTKFMEYGKESLRNHSKPDVYAFAKKSTANSGRLTLTCLATGFYPKSVTLHVRKFRTSLPEHLLTSSGVRPNEDGTYQLRKSVEIQEDETVDYDCYVHHSSLSEPIIHKWDRKCTDCSGGLGVIIGGVSVVVILLAVLGVVIFVLRKIGVFGGAGNGQAGSQAQVAQQTQQDTAIPLIDPSPTSPEGLTAGGSDSDSGRGSDSTRTTCQNSDVSSESGSSGGGSARGSAENIGQSSVDERISLNPET